MTKPAQVARMLENCITLKIPFYMSGPVGAGKSQVAQQVAEKMKREFIDVRLSQMDPTDIKGFPSPDHAAGVMHWLPADFLPPMKLKNGKPNDSEGVLFLDELVSAPLAVQAASYQLILDRKVGNYELPKNWAIAGAGNRAIDRSIVNKMAAALANRLVHVDFEVDLDDWVAHSFKSGITPETIAFIRFKSNLLHSFDPAQNPAAFPTPRSWFTVDKIMQANLNASDEHQLIKGTVGEGAAGEYSAFVRVMKELPTADEIKISPDTTNVPDSPGTLWALTTSLAMATDAKTFPRFLQYVERMTTEWQVVYIRDCLKHWNAVKFEKAFTKWGIAHHEVVL